LSKAGSREGRRLTPSLHGATVTSWKVNGREHMFLSKKAVLDGSAAVSHG
jgi:D-hexose-6-phosphate mutarotase